MYIHVYTYIYAWENDANVVDMIHGSSSFNIYMCIYIYIFICLCVNIMYTNILLLLLSLLLLLLLFFIRPTT